MATKKRQGAGGSLSGPVRQIAAVDGKFTMIKYPGKGGWTYISIPSFGDRKKTYFGSEKVNLVLDGHKFDNVSIWKMKDGNYFLPVKAEIRKKIGKQEGDTVHVQLFKIPEVLENTDEILLCLKEEPLALKRWKNLPADEQQRLSDWIINAPKEQIKVDRLADLINSLLSPGKLRV